MIKNEIENTKFKAFGYPDEFIKHGTTEELEKLYGLDVENIVDYIEKSI